MSDSTGCPPCRFPLPFCYCDSALELQEKLAAQRERRRENMTCFRCGKTIDKLLAWVFGLFPICLCCWGESLRRRLAKNDGRPLSARSYSDYGHEVAAWLAEALA